MKIGKRFLLLTIVAILGTSSLAFFTDVKGGVSSAKAALVSLVDQTVPVSTVKVEPGDVIPLNVRGKYTGNIDAQSRVLIKGSTNAVFKVYKRGTTVPLAVTPTGNVVYNSTAVVKPNGLISVDLDIKLLEATGNEFQNSSYKFSYEIQVRQNDNATWETIGSI